jgi:hypothetical protein
MLYSASNGAAERHAFASEKHRKECPDYSDAGMDVSCAAPITCADDLVGVSNGEQQSQQWHHHNMEPQQRPNKDESVDQQTLPYPRAHSPQLKK